MYYLKFGEYNYYKDIKELILQNYSVENIDILDCLFKLRPSRIITTNWDNLLEKYIENNAESYDIISSDEDLLRSDLSNKVIKMHGDFDKNNIVFKEDDYSLYEKNFPIITNYIKNILTSHTVLFLGYSYSDFNVRNIFSWLQDFSKNRPPIYMFMKEDKGLYSKYYDNLGVKLINSKRYADLFKFISKILEQKNNRNESIFEKIKNSLKFERALSINEIESITKGYFSGFEEITIYSDENIYSEYQDLYNKYIKNDSRGHYHPDKKYIDKFLFQNYIKRINAVRTVKDSNNQFSRENITLIESKEKNKLSEKLNSNIYFEIDSKSYIGLYESGKYDELLEILEKDYIFYKKEKNYFMFLIVAYNLELFQMIYNQSKEFTSNNTLSKFDNCLDNSYISLPKASQIKAHQDYLFLKSYFDKEKSKVYDFYKVIEKDVKNISLGGMVFKNNLSKERIEHFYFLKFLYENNSLIPCFNEFYTINQEYLGITLYRQINQSSFEFSILEVFAFINQRNNMRDKFAEYFLKKEGDQEYRNIVLGEVKVEQIMTIGDNLLSQYIKQYNNKDNLFEMRLTNYFNLISYIDIGDDYFSKTIELFNKCLDLSPKIFSQLFTAFNNYIAEQYNRFSREIDSEKLGTLMNKYIENHFLLALNTYSTLTNLIHVCLESKFKYDKYFKIEECLYTLKSENDACFIQGMLQILNIYNLLDETCQDRVKDALDTFNFTNEEIEIYDKPRVRKNFEIFFELFLYVSFYNIKIENKSFPSDIAKKFLTYLERSKHCSSSYLNLLENLKNVREKNQSFIEDEVFNELIEQLEVKQNNYKKFKDDGKSYPI
ncbi:SIR2 family protein [Francisella sp. LA112445]|uniref:SIR2 family NAD-dependent protein deacylase n=1 Tax=Francisella sp. LA112445 TaxID=1395624 RepID=UPI001788BD66|nr:SIR2 family protein [Francisella sp. LA112445]